MTWSQQNLWVAAWQNQQNDMCPAKTQISLGIRPVWSESSLCAPWVAKDPMLLHADSEDSDQTGRMPRLIWVFAGRTGNFVCFCHAAAPILKPCAYSSLHTVSDQSTCCLYTVVGPWLPIDQPVKTVRDAWIYRLIRIFTDYTSFFRGFVWPLLTQITNVLILELKDFTRL